MTNITKAAQQALAALETCRIRSVTEWEVTDVTPKNVTQAIDALRAALQDKALAVQGYEPAGFLLHWPATGGGRQTIWSETRAPGLAIGCPVTEIFKASAVAE